MATSINRTQLLGEAHKHGYFAQKASLQAANVPTNQHNVGVAAKKAEAKTQTKSSAPKETSEPKTTAKKTAAKKTPAKKSAAKQTSSKKS